MRNLSLEQVYKRINKKILIVGGYTEDKSIINIIKSCRLKPISIFNGNFNPNNALETIWVDEFDNNIEIKNKKAKINLNTRQIQQTTTDIFKNETISFIVEHSSLACVGLYPDSQNFILLLKGTDNYLRSYTYLDNQLLICSPLFVGLKVLKCCFPKQLKYFQKLTIKSEIKNNKEVEWFITTLPAHKLLLPNIATYDKLRSILYNE